MRGRTRSKYFYRLQKYRKYKQKNTKRRQYGGFLNRYDFAYAGRDTVNQAIKGLNTLTPKLINQTSKEVDKIAPQIIRGAIENVYKTPFRLLGNFGKQKFRKWKKDFCYWLNKNELNNRQNSAITKFILRYGRRSDTSEGYNNRTKGDSIPMTFFYYKLHMKLSKNNKHEELILRWNFLSLKKCTFRMDRDKK